MSLISLVMELYVSGKVPGQYLVRWWSERGRDVYRSGKTRFCHIPTTGHCRHNIYIDEEVKGSVSQRKEGVSS